MAALLWQMSGNALAASLLLHMVYRPLQADMPDMPVRPNSVATKEM